ncbi:hypothetical protein [Bordetella avium]|uniref:hypothetical protein n=1 Tax=Bordetella avium TaxID=521 RepID=UPI000E67B021|nr:hypothetical protein [Bordetella avium]RIQ49541.1 hypothetical protein D0843_13645 [Bordetella avium]
MRILCLLVVALMLTGCAASPTLYVPRIVPPLDSQLATPCPELPEPPQNPADYDAWQAWVQDQVLVAYGVCAARHRATVGARPK